MDFLKTTRSSIAATALLLMGGCGDEISSISLVPVKGTITLNGEPLPNAQISFVPDPSNSAQTPGGGTTGVAGTYTANFRDRPGLAPGKYKVSIAPPDGEDVKVDAALNDYFKDDPFMLSETKRGLATSSSKSRGKQSLPAKVEFDAEVEAGGSEIDHDVKRAAQDPAVKSAAVDR